MSDEHDRQDGSIKILLAVATALIVGAVTNGVAVWSDVRLLSAGVARIESDLVRMDTAITAIAAEVRSNTVHRIEHAREAERLAKQLESTREIVESLRRQPAARPDPFTGTEGRALSDRIDRLEGRDPH